MYIGLVLVLGNDVIEVSVCSNKFKDKESGRQASSIREAGGGLQNPYQ